MKKLFRLVQFAANFAIIISVLLLTFVVVDRYVISPKAPDQTVAATSATTAPAPKMPDRSLSGTVLPLKDAKWTEGQTTVVLYLSTGCHFCAESTGFYQRLIAEKANKTFKVIAVFPQSVEDGNKYLESHNIKVDQVVSNTLASTGITGTPTLMFVTEGGVVFDAWRGKLDDAGEKEVLERLSRQS